MKVVAFLVVLLLAMGVVGTFDYQDAELSAKAQELHLSCVSRTRPASKPGKTATRLIAYPAVNGDTQIFECRLLEERT